MFDITKLIVAYYFETLESRPWVRVEHYLSVGPFYALTLFPTLLYLYCFLYFVSSGLMYLFVYLVGRN